MASELAAIWEARVSLSWSFCARAWIWVVAAWIMRQRNEGSVLFVDIFCLEMGWMGRGCLVRKLMCRSR